jgi:signal transduction histidine kinase
LQFQRPHSDAEDELDIVAKAINRMQLTLKEDLELRTRMEQKLLRHQEDLEQTVHQRTSELQIKNALLELQSLELEANNQDLDSYAQSVAHDLKNPLTTLIGLSSLLNYSLASFSPEKLQESINTIHRTSIKMVNIIDALLLLSSVRKSTDIDIKPLDIKHIASEAQHRLASLAEKAHASINFVGDWPMAMGYAQWVEEVWMNYLSNAIKYGGNPPIIEIGGELISPTLAKFWVRDFGKGINKEKSEKLFLPFSRIDHTTSDGHGLGLSIVKRIVERLNGKVGYEAGDKNNSDPSADVGGYFWFTLPINNNKGQ